MTFLNNKYLKRITSRLICFVLAIASVSPLSAYEVSTHKEMSRVAYSRSVLATDASLLNDLGIKATDPFLNSNSKERFILDLVLDGSEFEDAIFAIDPDDEGLRMKHHFYNQQNDGRALVYPPLLGPNASIKTYSSADWALEDLSDVPEQNFSLNDAYDSFYNALTDRPNRKIHWGWVFQSLGHAIHHVQDMAQPQHTRNDAHTPLEDAERKLYESYTKEREEMNSLSYLGYPDIDIAQFTSARMFWDGVNASEDMGLAEFSSENFVSEGTNFSEGNVQSSYVVGASPAPGQPLPATDNLKITSTEQIFNFTIPLSWLEPSSLPFTFTDITVSGTRHDIGTQVTDQHNPANSGFNEKTSTFSVIDSDLDAIDGAMIYALDRTNYDEAHKFLIPKAVSYSAGLIDYFFRGRIEASLTADGDGIEIKNVSKGNFEFGVADAFEVYYETDSGIRNPINNLSNLLLVSALPINGTHTITGLSAALQGVSDMGSEGRIIVLFDGDIGSERGMAVANSFLQPSPSNLQPFAEVTAVGTRYETQTQYNPDYYATQTTNYNVIAQTFATPIGDLTIFLSDVVVTFTASGENFSGTQTTINYRPNVYPDFSSLTGDPSTNLLNRLTLNNRGRRAPWREPTYNVDVTLTKYWEISELAPTIGSADPSLYTVVNSNVNIDSRLSPFGPFIENLAIEDSSTGQVRNYNILYFITAGHRGQVCSSCLSTFYSAAAAGKALMNSTPSYDLSRGFPSNGLIFYVDTGNVYADVIIRAHLVPN